jgi:hypothetical protein
MTMMKKTMLKRNMLKRTMTDLTMMKRNLIYMVAVAVASVAVVMDAKDTPVITIATIAALVPPNHVTKRKQCLAAG